MTQEWVRTRTSMADRLRLEMPPRSVLVSLRPIGVGTGNVESLNSYFLRLADAHQVTPRALAREVVFPERSKFDGNRWKHFTEAWKHPNFNGIGDACGKWVETVEALTMVNGLHRLTMSFLNGRACWRGLVSRQNRWCPACLRESAEQGTPYGQLLWSFEAVTACPIHRTRLVDRCRCGPAETCRIGTVKNLPHICPKCAVDLWAAHPLDLEPPTDRELLRSGLVADLLAGDFASGEVTSNRDLADFVKDSITRHAQGQAAILAERLGVGKTVMHGWVHRNHVLCFSQIIDIAEAHGCSITDVLCGRSEAIKISPMIPLAMRKKVPARVRRRIQWDVIEGGLKEIVIADPPISVTEAGRRLGVFHEHLRIRYPDICSGIAKRWRLWQTAKSDQRRAELGDVVREVARDLAKAGMKPTWRRVSINLTKTNARPSMLRNGYGYYRAIVTEVQMEFFPNG